MAIVVRPDGETEVTEAEGRRIAEDEGIFPFQKLKVGDQITIPVRERRKWWQLWKPQWVEPQPREYRITGVTSSTIKLPR